MGLNWIEHFYKVTGMLLSKYLVPEFCDVMRSTFGVDINLRDVPSPSGELARFVTGGSFVIVRTHEHGRDANTVEVGCADPSKLKQIEAVWTAVCSQAQEEESTNDVDESDH